MPILRPQTLLHDEQHAERKHAQHPVKVRRVKSSRAQSSVPFMDASVAEVRVRRKLRNAGKAESDSVASVPTAAYPNPPASLPAPNTVNSIPVPDNSPNPPPNPSVPPILSAQDVENLVRQIISQLTPPLSPDNTALDDIKSQIAMLTRRLNNLR